MLSSRSIKVFKRESQKSLRNGDMAHHNTDGNEEPLTTLDNEMIRAALETHEIANTLHSGTSPVMHNRG